MTDIAWTDERIATLRRLRGEGATFGECAAEIGCSRNAAIGKAGRLGIPCAAQRPPRPPRRTRKPRVLVNIGARADRADFVHFELPPDRVEDGATPHDQRKQLLNLTNETCRWPVGDPGTPGFFFCGAPEADCDGGKPYCRAHAAVAFAGRPLRRPYVPMVRRAA